MFDTICLGAAFNPIHHGHLLCARAVLEKIRGNRDSRIGVRLIPTGSPPHKKRHSALASAPHRLAMCRLALRGLSDSSDFFIDDREIRRPGPSYTILTVRQLRAEGFSKIAWLIGADQLNVLPTWRQAEALLDEVHFLVMARPGTMFRWSALPKKFRALRHNIVTVPQIDISSTDIRLRIKQNKPIDFLMPPPVIQYIRRHDVYRT